MKEELKQFLLENTDIFAWKHSDMVGIDPSGACHVLKVDPKLCPKIQQRRPLSTERYSALKEEVDKLLANGFIREAVYPQWVSNPVLVRKSTKKWRVCIDFSDLNQTCPKDCFSLPHFHQLVDTTADHKLLSFMDAYSGYNQILMFGGDEDHTSFITDQGLYCYRMMSFSLKNVGATYQRLVNRMFAGQIGNNMEVYVDDMLVKSVNTEDHIGHLRGMFGVLRKYRMKTQPPEVYLRSRIQEVHRPSNEGRGLNGQKSARKPSKTSRSSSERPRCCPSLKNGETLLVYLVMSEKVVSSVLIREEGPLQLPVYYIDVLTNLLSETDTPKEGHLRKVDEMVHSEARPEEIPTWKLYVDGSSGEARAGAEILLVSPDGHNLNCALRPGV
ncbi:Ribonuclease H [Abeliophyllum distichum]|uniref:Ribonuclease H n=1 Tax=Abeliophyllum distichum TaxID=126358 RepID=A0ABD1QYW4_9LAMI